MLVFLEHSGGGSEGRSHSLSAPRGRSGEAPYSRNTPRKDLSSRVAERAIKCGISCFSGEQPSTEISSNLCLLLLARPGFRTPRLGAARPPRQPAPSRIRARGGHIRVCQ